MTIHLTLYSFLPQERGCCTACAYHSRHGTDDNHEIPLSQRTSCLVLEFHGAEARWMLTIDGR